MESSKEIRKGETVLCFFHDANEEQMMKVKGVGKRTAQLVDNLRNRRKYWEQNEEAEDRKKWKPQFNSRT